MTYIGGLRERLIGDSVHALVRDGLAALGWLDVGRQHLPIQIITEPYRDDQEIPLNTVVISDDISDDIDAEMGSTLGEITTTYYVDFYAENEALGKHLIHDVRDLLRGRVPSAGRTRAVLPVYDYQLATPMVIFSCDIEDVMIDRARGELKPWQRFWRVCRFDVVDYYASESDIDELDEQIFDGGGA